LIEESNHINYFIDRSATCFELLKKYIYIYIFNSFRTYLTLDSSGVMYSMTKFLSIKEIFKGFPYLYLESKG